MGNEGKKELHKRIYMNLLWTLMILLCIVFVVPPLIRFFMPLIVAWIIAAIANPMVRFLENKIKIMRKHGSVIVIVLVLLAVGALLYGIGYVTVAQTSPISAVGSFASSFDRYRNEYTDFNDFLFLCCTEK